MGSRMVFSDGVSEIGINDHGVYVGGEAGFTFLAAMAEKIDSLEEENRNLRQELAKCQANES